MINTIHRSVVEKLKIEVMGDEEHDGVFGYLKKIIETDEKTFKLCLRNNVPCWVYRETFVVEHDTEKNKIIFKKYWVRKQPVFVKNLKTLKLKTYKSYKSLTIDIATGEFITYTVESTYNRRKKNTPSIRKNLFNYKTISNVESIFSESTEFITKESLYEGLHKAMRIIGYNDAVTNMFSQNYLRTIYRNNKKTIHVYDYVFMFLVYNYFKKLGIILPNRNNILEYAFNFRSDKKSYTNKSIYNYYANYFGTDELFIAGLFDYRDQLNMNIYVGNQNIDWFDDDFSEKSKPQDLYYAINESGITILYKLGYTVSEIKSSQQLLNIAYDRNNDLSGFYQNPLELPLDILMDNKEFFKSIIKDTTITTIVQMLTTLRTFRDVYGVATSGYLMYLTSVKSILDALDESTEETGLYVVSKGFLNRLKKQLPKNARCSVTKHINKKIQNNDKSIPLSLSYITNVTPSPSATIVISYKNERMKLNVFDSYIDYIIYDKKTNSKFNDLKDSVLSKSFGNFHANYKKSKNKFKYTGLKAHYSKKRFQELLKEKFSEKDLKIITENLVYLK